jgi:hypothetical protein
LFPMDCVFKRRLLLPNISNDLEQRHLPFIYPPPVADISSRHLLSFEIDIPHNSTQCSHRILQAAHIRNAITRHTSFRVASISHVLVYMRSGAHMFCVRASNYSRTLSIDTPSGADPFLAFSFPDGRRPIITVYDCGSRPFIVISVYGSRASTTKFEVFLWVEEALHNVCASPNESRARLSVSLGPDRIRPVEDFPTRLVRSHTD